MKMVVGEEKGIVVIRVKEQRLDAHVSDCFKKELKRLYEEGKKRILVDMTDVLFIDSSGLGAFVTALRVANAHRGTLQLAGLRPQVQAMFDLTRLNLILRIFPSAVEALDSDREKAHGSKFN